MSDRLDAIAAGLRDGRYDCRVPGDTDDVRWLAGEVRRLREAHAEAVEAAYREGFGKGWGQGWDHGDLARPCDAAWLQSEARKAVARDDG